MGWFRKLESLVVNFLKLLLALRVGPSSRGMGIGRTGWSADRKQSRRGPRPDYRELTRGVPTSMTFSNNFCTVLYIDDRPTLLEACHRACNKPEQCR